LAIVALAAYQVSAADIPSPPPAAAGAAATANGINRSVVAPPAPGGAAVGASNMSNLPNAQAGQQFQGNGQFQSNTQTPGSTGTLQNPNARTFQDSQAPLPSGMIESKVNPQANTAGDPRPDQWRYRWNNNQWWYWTPENRWMVYGSNGWAYPEVTGGYTTGYGGVTVETPAAGVSVAVPSSGYYYAPGTTYYYPSYGYYYPGRYYYGGPGWIVGRPWRGRW
jgi:hypothetical protein